MIKLKSLLKENIIEDTDKKYPLAGNIVDGRKVKKNIDNWSSIEASLYHYEILDGIREVPMSDFSLTGKHYNANEMERTKQLAAQIKESNSISPLIVVVDRKGPYILEGSHRIDALKLLNAKSFPALIVVDLD